MTTQSDPHLLDALTSMGVLMSVSVRYWRGKRKLAPEDLGLQPDRLDPRLISLGHKRLLPKEQLEALALAESRAHACLEENSFPFLGGLARYVPNRKLADVLARLDGIKGQFLHAQEAFLGRYAELREISLQEWRQQATTLRVDPVLAAQVVEAQFPPAQQMPRLFSFEVQTFQLAVPEVSAGTLVEIGTRVELLAAREQACAVARRQIEASCQSFITDCAATLRQQTAQLCDEMLQTINGTGNVHQKTLNRLIRFIDHFRIISRGTPPKKIPETSTLVSSTAFMSECELCERRQSHPSASSQPVLPDG